MKHTETISDTKRAAENIFLTAYKKLNNEQKRAVDALEGPVMVVAGPGTGKTQVLSLRIANILRKTDVGASLVLCLTFTRSGVTAMRKRLMSIIGTDANKVVINTFHGFAQRLVEKHYELLGFKTCPELLDDTKSVFLTDEILYSNSWEYLRPRANPATYFGDIKNLISLLKRESLSPEDFKLSIDAEIEFLINDPTSISLRGETKGQLKKEIQTKIESLNKTREVVDFYHAYEAAKRERCLMDYDDVLNYAVQLVTDYEDVCAEIRENHQYVLVDEHQDSSGIQNAFLKAVWADTEQPNLFVVGDDRQLIYGFGGASMNHFTDFVNTFPSVQLITLIHNYRSTTPILDLADTLLTSELAEGKLVSNHLENHRAHQVTLAEYDYSRDEVIAAGLYFKQKIEQGTPAGECALLVPKNHQVKSAVQILTSLGVPVSDSSTESLFATREYADLRRVFQIMTDPHNAIPLAESLFDPIAHIPPIDAHHFLKSLKPKQLSLQQLVSFGDDQGLFADENPIVDWGNKITELINETAHENIVATIAHVGNTLLVNTAENHQALVHNVEVVRTLIHLATEYQSHHPHQTLRSFITYLDRLEEYGTQISVAVIGGSAGVQIMTLHGSKGLEFDHVWIAHMNQSTLMNQRRGGFTLPKTLAEKVEKKDELTARREVYVAITRAKTFCTISYAQHDTRGADLEPAHIIAQLPEVHFTKKTIEQTVGELLVYGASIYTTHDKPIVQGTNTEQLIELVRNRYSENTVSVTLLNNFFECPWKWYFRNFLQLPDSKTASLIFGSAMHSVLEIIVRDTKAPTKKQLETLIHDALIQEGIDEKTLDQDIQKGIACIQHFIDKDFKNLAKNRLTERSVSYRDPAFPNLSMYGKIDLTETFPDGTIVVTDFKTGSKSGAPTASSIQKIDAEGRLSGYLRQLAMYSYLIAGNDRGMSSSQVAVSKLYFIEAPEHDKNRVFQTHITGEQIELLKKDIADYQQAIESGSWISQTCHFKPYGTGVTTCEYCKRAREVYGK